MDNENKIRLVLETQGVDKMSEAAKSVEDLAEQVDLLDTAFVDLSSGSIEKTIKAVEELDDSISTGLIKSTGEYWVTLKDGQRLLANTADGFRKLIDDEGRYLITLSDGRRVWNDSKAAIDATNEALLRYQKEMNRAAIETGETLESVQDFMSGMRQALKTGIEEPTEDVMHFVSRLGKTPEEVGKANESIKKMASESGRQGDTGRKMMELSYMLDDIQYGFHGITNNIPRFAGAFGLGASAVGAVGIAAVGLNQALTYLGPLLAGTEKPLKPLKERLDEFAKGLGGSKVEAEKLTNEIQKMAERVPDIFRSFDETLSKINGVIAAQKELDSMKKEDDKRESDAVAERARIDARQNKNNEKGGVYKEYVEGMTPDQDVALSEKLAADQMSKARNDVIDSQVAQMEASGAFDGRMVGKDTLRQLAKEAIKNKTPESNDQIKAAARKRADEIRNKAMQGDSTALTTVEGVSPEFSQFEKDTLEDEQFNTGLERRSNAGAERRKREADLQKNNAAYSKKIGTAQKGLIDKIGSQQRIDGLGIILNNDIDDKIREAANELVRDAVGKLGKSNSEAAQKSADIAKSRNEAMAKLEPFQAAAQRQLQAGTGPNANRNLAALRKRDSQLFQQKLMAGGMGRGEAEESANQSLTGGEKQLNDFAKMSGNNTKSILGMNRAAQMAMQRLEATQNEQQRQMDIQAQNFNQIQPNNNAGRPRWQGGARSR